MTRFHYKAPQGQTLVDVQNPFEHLNPYDVPPQGFGGGIDPPSLLKPLQILADGQLENLQIAITPFEFASKFGTVGTNPGQFQQPVDIAKDSLGFLYVLDETRKVVIKFTAAGVFTGLEFNGSEGLGTAFVKPRAISIDSLDRIYISQVANTHIQRYTTSGTFINKTNVTINQARKVGFRSNGDMLVCAAELDRIEVYNSDLIFQYNIGGPGSGNLQFNNPQGLHVNNNDSFYVCDSINDRIQLIDALDAFVSEFGVTGSGDGSDGVIYFQNPLHIIVDEDGTIFVSDNGLNRIMIVTKNHEFLDTFGEFGTANGQFRNPFGLIFDSAGENVIIVDQNNDRVQVLVLPLLEDLEISPSVSLDNTYQFFQNLQIDEGQIPEGDTHDEFPLLLHFTLGANRILDPSGNDLVLFSRAGGPPIPFYVLFFDEITGEFWIRAQAPAATVGSQFQLIYGKSGAIDQSDKTGVWNSNYSMAMELDKLEGGVFKDSTNNENDSLAPINTVIVPAQVNKGISVTANGFVDIPNDSSLDPGTGDFLCMIWTSSNNVTLRTAPIGKNSGAGQFRGWEILFSPAGFDDMVSVILKATNNHQIGIVAQKILSDGVRNLIAFSWQPNNISPDPKLRVFVDDEEPTPAVFAADTLVPGDVIAELNDLSIGSAGGPAHNNKWQGINDDAIIRKVLPSKIASFIKSYFNATKAPATFLISSGEEVAT